MKRRCFVISPIGEPGSQIREHADNVFEFIIQPAMECLELMTVRADQLLEPGKITDQVFREIFASDLCVAILTGHNPNVFYELALAQAAQRPVIVLIEKGEVIPFDVRDLRCVVYDLKPRNLFNRTYVDQLVAQLRSLQQRHWSMESPFDAFFRDSGFEAASAEPGIEHDGTGYSVGHGKLTVRVVMGRIEKVEVTDDALIALPANEYFDDDCIRDTRSALGAYMQHHFAGRIPQVQALVASALSCLPTTSAEKTPGVRVPSYGVGTCIYLDRPLGSTARLAMVAVTTKRAGEGLRSKPRHVYDSMLALHRVMVDHRLTSLYVPLLGSGHGGLTSEFSLHCMLTALAELRREPAGAALHRVQIVLYQPDASSKPPLPPKTIKRALAVFCDLLRS